MAKKQTAAEAAPEVETPQVKEVAIEKPVVKTPKVEVEPKKDKWVI